MFSVTVQLNSEALQGSPWIVVVSSDCAPGRTRRAAARVCNTQRCPYLGTYTVDFTCIACAASQYTDTFNALQCEECPATTQVRTRACDLALARLLKSFNGVCTRSPQWAPARCSTAHV